MRIESRLVLLLAACLVPLASLAQTADEIIKQHIAAMGGVETLRATTSVK